MILLKVGRFEKLNGVERKEVKINGRVYILRILCECVCERVRGKRRERRRGKGRVRKREEERRQKTIMKIRS